MAGPCKGVSLWTALALAVFYCLAVSSTTSGHTLLRTFCQSQPGLRCNVAQSLLSLRTDLENNMSERDREMTGDFSTSHAFSQHQTVTSLREAFTETLNSLRCMGQTIDIWSADPQGYVRRLPRVLYGDVLHGYEQMRAALGGIGRVVADPRRCHVWTSNPARVKALSYISVSRALSLLSDVNLHCQCPRI